jgi:hypothetical protein
MGLFPGTGSVANYGEDIYAERVQGDPLAGPPVRDQKLAPSQVTGCPAAMMRVVFLRIK